MSNLIERIAKSVEFAEKEGENMDDVSWGMQEGILISYNEANKIVSLYETLVEVADLLDNRNGDEGNNINSFEFKTWKICNDELRALSEP